MHGIKLKYTIIFIDFSRLRIFKGMQSRHAEPYKLMHAWRNRTSMHAFMQTNELYFGGVCDIYSVQEGLFT